LAATGPRIEGAAVDFRDWTKRLDGLKEKKGKG
jgi:hypothetical protein